MTDATIPHRDIPTRSGEDDELTLLDLRLVTAVSATRRRLSVASITRGPEVPYQLPLHTWARPVGAVCVLIAVSLALVAPLSHTPQSLAVAVPPIEIVASTDLLPRGELAPPLEIAPSGPARRARSRTRTAARTADGHAPRSSRLSIAEEPDF